VPESASTAEVIDLTSQQVERVSMKSLGEKVADEITSMKERLSKHKKSSFGNFDVKAEKENEKQAIMKRFYVPKPNQDLFEKGGDITLSANHHKLAIQR